MRNNAHVKRKHQTRIWVDVFVDLFVDTVVSQSEPLAYLTVWMVPDVCIRSVNFEGRLASIRSAQQLLQATHHHVIEFRLSDFVDDVQIC